MAENAWPVIVPGPIVVFYFCKPSDAATIVRELTLLTPYVLQRNDDPWSEVHRSYRQCAEFIKPWVAVLVRDPLFLDYLDFSTAPWGLWVVLENGEARSVPGAVGQRFFADVADGIEYPSEVSIRLGIADGSCLAKGSEE